MESHRVSPLSSPLRSPDGSQPLCPVGLAFLTPGGAQQAGLTGVLMVQQGDGPAVGQWRRDTWGE